MKEGKQDEGLTAGQTAAVERNDKRIEVLKAELISLEAQIRGKQEQRASSAQSGAATSSAVGRSRRCDDDDDEALDTTAETMDASTNWRVKKKLKQAAGGGQQSSGGSCNAPGGGPMTYDGLKAEWDSKKSEVTALEGQVEKLRGVLVECERRGTARLDDLDVYMVTSQKKEAESQLKQLLSQVEVGNVALQRLSKLMKVAAPALMSLHNQNQTPASAAKIKADTISVPGPSSSDTGQTTSVGVTASDDQVTKENKQDDDDGFISREALLGSQSRKPATVALGIPIKKSPSIIESSSNNVSADTEISHKRKREDDESCGRTAPSASVTDEESVSIQASVTATNKEGNIVGTANTALNPPPLPLVAAGTVPGTTRIPESFQPSMKLAAGPAPPTSIVKGPTRRPDVPPKPLNDDLKVSYKSSTLEGGDAVWCPPKNQTGDGKTSLNAKYGY